MDGQHYYLWTELVVWIVLFINVLFLSSCIYVYVLQVRFNILIGRGDNIYYYILVIFVLVYLYQHSFLLSLSLQLICQYIIHIYLVTFMHITFVHLIHIYLYVFLSSEDSVLRIIFVCLPFIGRFCCMLCQRNCLTFSFVN